MAQYASAFHYFSAAINLQKVPNTNPTAEDARCYTYLGVALCRLDDYDNAYAAYDKSIELMKHDPISRLNYAISLACNEENERAKEQLREYESIISTTAGVQLKGDDKELDLQHEKLKMHLLS